MKWIIVCCVTLVLWSAAPKAEANVGQLQLAPVGQGQFESLLENKSYFLGNDELVSSPALGVLRQANGEGSSFFFVLLPSIFAGVAFLTAVIGGFVSLRMKRGRLGWGICNLVMAGLGLVAAAVLLATGVGFFGLISLAVGLFHTVFGVTLVNLYKKARRARKRGLRASASRAGFHMQGFSPAGVTFSF